MMDLVDVVTAAGTGMGAAIEAQVRQSYGTARALLQAEPAERGRLASVIHSAQMAIEREARRLAQVSAAENRRNVGCVDGCAHCCFQHVQVSTTEAVLLAVTIIDQEATLRVAEASARRVERMTSSERYRATVPCMFLINRRCSVHDLRPMACRTHFSLSRFACDKDWRERLRSERGTIPMPAAPKAMGAAMMLGLDMAVGEIGLETELVELSVAMRTILQRGALDRWLAGERVFAGVRHVAPGRPYSEAVAEALAQWGGARAGGARGAAPGAALGPPPPRRPPAA